jgi:peptidyl-prolyl cis-trans isomerase C/peptidyl-prolyl cis-trans isomerase D
MKASIKALVLSVAVFSFQMQAAVDVLATAGSATITRADFQRKLDEIRRQTNNPPQPEQFIEDLVRYEIGVQEAEKMNLQNDPMVKERYKQVLYNALLEKQIGQKVESIKINESEMRDFYKKNPELHLSHILIEVKSDAKPEEREIVRKRALEIVTEIKGSKRPFEELAKLYTDDLSTKEVGGDIGFQSRLTLAPLLYDAAAAMKKGEVKGPIETKFGYYILKLNERKAYDMADKRLIRAAVYDEKRAKAFNDYFNKLKKNYKIQVNQCALKTVR